MSRLAHGETPDVRNDGAPILESIAPATRFAAGVPLPDFGYMFSASPEARPDEADRLPENGDMLARLDALGGAMAADDPGEISPKDDLVRSTNDKVPAGFTYFGQFIDHDITIAKEPLVAGKDRIFGDFVPLESLDTVANGRTPLLELDSVYGPSLTEGTDVPPPVDGHMVLGQVSFVPRPPQGPDIFNFVPGKSAMNDVPRKPRVADPGIDREALIGDPRNDENLIVQQLHTGFLKAHNTLVDITGSFEAARERLTLMYQSAVIDDYLPRICDAAVLERIVDQGPRFFTPAGPLYMPIEFAAAGFRFGHSMVRAKYSFNLNFPDTDSAFAFTFTALQGSLDPGTNPNQPPPPPDERGTDTFPHNWVIEWNRFLQLDGSNPQAARPIDPRLTPLLTTLRDAVGVQETGIAAHLARRNLRRGYLFSLPTGQAVAAKLGVAPIEISAETTRLGAEVVAPFAQRTPLWLYVLAEAGLNGGKLGAVGTTILAETFVTLIRRSKPSIFDSHGGRVPGTRYRLSDILKLASLQDS